MPLTSAQTAAYLKRIGWAGPVSPDAETLGALQRAHLLAVPFENLDIAAGIPIALDEDRLFDKIVGRRRGGFCYELNGLYASLLQALGFRVTLLAARVYDAAGAVGMAFDHLTLRVDGREIRLSDVGFGDSALVPVRMDEESLGEPQTDGRARYAVGRFGWGAFRLLRRDESFEAWRPQYLFDLVPRRLAEFGGGRRYHQTSPESPFTRKSLCSRATPSGRLTLSDGRLIRTEGGRREERAVRPEEAEEILVRAFSFLPEEARRLAPASVRTRRQ